MKMSRMHPTRRTTRRTTHRTTRRTNRRTLGLALAALMALPAAALAQAQDYPTKPVRMVVAFAAGGPTDVLARVVAAGLAKSLGQQVIIENRPGAGGAIGTRQVAQAAADGYTLLFGGDAALTVLPQISRNAGYDGLRSFTPLRLVASQNNVLMASADREIPDVNTLVAKAKAKPGTISFGSAGNGSPSHLIGALFESQKGIDLMHVPYKGAAPAITDLIGGQVDLMFVGTPVALQNASRKELVPLAVTGAKRLPGLPDVPTFEEAGVSGLGADTAIWWSLMAPAKLPPAIAKKVDAAIQAALNDAEVKSGLAAQGVEVLNLDANTTAQWLERDRKKWGALIGSGRIAKD